MPTLVKLSPEEVDALRRTPPGQMALIRAEYDQALEPYEVGDMGMIELTEGEDENKVISRIKSAAVRKGMKAWVRRKRGHVYFQMVDANEYAAQYLARIAAQSKNGTVDEHDVLGEYDEEPAAVAPAPQATAPLDPTIDPETGKKYHWRTLQRLERERAEAAATTT